MQPIGCMSRGKAGFGNPQLAAKSHLLACFASNLGKDDPSDADYLLDLCSIIANGCARRDLTMSRRALSHCISPVAEGNTRDYRNLQGDLPPVV